MKLEELWLSICKGDRPAFRTLYSNCAKDVLSYGYRYSRDKQLVEDATQDVFVHLWNTHASLPEVSNVKAYLYTSLRRRLFRKLEYAPKWNNLEEENETPFSATFFVEESAYEGMESQADKIKEVKSMLASLSGRQKEIVYLKYFEGMDYDEIAQIMGLEYQSARNLMNKALKKLRKLWVFIIFVGQIGYKSLSHVPNM